MVIEFILPAIILSVSLGVLAKASQFTITAFEDVMELTGLSEASAGFVVLALMTALPEMVVATFAVLEGDPGIAIGDMLGSNVFNIGVVLGVGASMGLLRNCRTGTLIEFVDILFLTSLIPIGLVFLGNTSQIIGVILLVIYGFNVYRMIKRRIPGSLSPGVSTKRRSIVLGKVIVGISVVVVAARFAVHAAVDIASLLGMPSILIGAKILAIGTSMPELMLDVVAMRRGRVELAIGDVFGSNLTNLTLILGVVLLVSPITIDLTVFTEIIFFVLVTTLIVWRYLTKGGIPPTGGIVLLITYIIFQAIL
jgi:cation:H+ antiporter